MGKKHIRVCHVITQLELGGAQENTLALVERLPADRYETHLICGPGGILDEEVRACLGDRCIFVPSLIRRVCPIHDSLAYFSLKRIFQRERFDIVHTHSSKAGVIGRLAARAAATPNIFHTAHGWGFHDRQSAITHSLFVLVERRAARCSDVIVAVSEATRQKGLAAGIGKPEQYRVIREGIDSGLFRACADKIGLRRKLGVEQDRSIVSMIACLKPQKSPLDFVDVADRVRQKVEKVLFLLVGDGSLRGEIENEISRCGLQNTVRLLGWRRDVPDIVRASDLTLLTSRWEGLPRAVLESIAAGVPVIATAVDGTPEAVQDGVNGFLFAPGDTAGCANYISDLLLDPQKLSRLGETAASSWRDEFDLQSMVDRTDQLYRNRF